MINSCRGYNSVPGPLQTVQRAELWGVVFALQASDAVHLGVDNLNVVRHVGRLFYGVRSLRPAELVNDGDLLMLIDSILELWGHDTVRVTKSMGVLMRKWFGLDRLGNDAADEAADFGRRRVGQAVIDARNLSGVCWLWYPVILECHRRHGRF